MQRRWCCSMQSVQRNREGADVCARSTRPVRDMRAMQGHWSTNVSEVRRVHDPQVWVNRTPDRTRHALARTCHSPSSRSALLASADGSLTTVRFAPAQNCRCQPAQLEASELSLYDALVSHGAECPRCRKTRPAPEETVLTKGRRLCEYYCGACEHSWAVVNDAPGPSLADDCATVPRGSRIR